MTGGSWSGLTSAAQGPKFYLRTVKYIFYKLPEQCGEAMEDFLDNSVSGPLDVNNF
jgi:hypothetical protein